jgi:hypothetical protein
VKRITGGEFQAGDDGWPGMMSVRVYELDGMYDHPSLPMAGDTCQLLEIQCHSKLVARRIQRPKKGGKGDGSDDNGEVAATLDSRIGLESPLLWLRADPEMEYLVDIQIHQPVQMWISLQLSVWMEMAAEYELELLQKRRNLHLLILLLHVTHVISGIMLSVLNLTQSVQLKILGFARGAKQVGC